LSEPICRRSRLKVLVTGGTGFLGKRLRLVMPGWIYVGSSDCDLTNFGQVEDLLSQHQPDAIVHLAAYVGGIKRNVNEQIEFYEKNTLINTNVLMCARKNSITRILSSLSTCAYPDFMESYPFNGNDIYRGPPPKTNFTYGYTKRCLHVHSVACYEQLNLDYTTFVPSNLYGPDDNFDPDSSHFIPSLIRKICGTREGDTIEMWGTGNPLRQHLYVDDLANLIPQMLDKHISSVPLIVAPQENLSIRSVCNLAAKVLSVDRTFTFNGNLDGQFRKDGSCSELLKVFPDFSFTPLEQGFKTTYDWYMNSRG